MRHHYRSYQLGSYTIEGESDQWQVSNAGNVVYVTDSEDRARHYAAEANGMISWPRAVVGSLLIFMSVIGVGAYIAVQQSSASAAAGQSGD